MLAILKNPTLRQTHMLLLLAAAGALAVALVAQFALGLPPCKLCLWQRWPYVAIIPLSALAFFTPALQRTLLTLCAIALLANLGVAGYHVGVEHKIFLGSEGCTPSTSGDTIEDLRAAIHASPLVACDQPTALWLGISMAGWNALFLALLSVYTVRIIWRTRNPNP